eukprot:TRINITY_DN2395_c0_g1_i2.p1 TRINITY_DN2395_c0_g1~~TRINITY_DN2395_c0_g1_i2.p1  ORF type:complete len:526 (+),score=67.90 TRINITY_DN2395_c0_g1_i2:230-1579(+)
MAFSEPSRVFVLLSTALVHIMTPGLAFFYGGMVRKQSVLTVLLQSFTSQSIISLLWWLVGFSLCFGPGSTIYGNPIRYLALNGVDGASNLDVNGKTIENVSGFTFCVYQLTFAVITPAIITGAFLDRLRYRAYVLFIVMWFFLVYCPFAHLVWGGGWFEQLGVGDYAGGTVVHITSGWSALASSLVLGKRVTVKSEPHNIPFVVLGTALLWFGWFGFNGGSGLQIEGPASSTAYINSQLCASSAGICWVLVDIFVRDRPSIIGACIGVIVGLVLITPIAGYCQPWAAVVMGPIGVAFCYSAAELRKRYFDSLFDDALDVWSSHGVGGFIGCLLVGVLSDPSVCNPGEDSGIATPEWCSDPNTVSRSWLQFGKQALSASICAAWSFVATVAILKFLSLFMIIRIPEGKDNVDEYELAELAYGPGSESCATSAVRQTRTDVSAEASTASEF